MPLVSVIIPALEEEADLPSTLLRVRSQPFLGEILLVDGGSSDRTTDIAAAMGSKVLSTPHPGRSSQMNLGAAAASHDIFLFLHADTLLPESGLDRVVRILANPKVVGGAFARKFASNSVLLKITCLLAEFRNRTIGWHLGDQAIFCRRKTFATLGGFAPISPFEDLDFSRRMWSLGAVATLRPPVVSSARRFEKAGPLRRTWKDLQLTIGYIRGQRKTSSTPEMLLER